MRILNLYFKNINSLEGESRIDFEQSPFTDTGVFAITGPNGSGKSSILDAITLGLYGETFRFDRPSRHVMTKHTAESFSVIEFALGKNKYRSNWQVEREKGNPDGELMMPVMTLHQLSEAGEVVLADTPQQVCARIAELTGMNFRNFTRSIMLAQGDFAAFLNALDSERMDILEKIISTDIYTDYKNEVTAKNDLAQQQLAQLTQEMAGLPLMAAEVVEAHELDLIDFKEQYAEFEGQQNSLKQQQSALQNIDRIQGQIVAQEKVIQDVKQQAENTQAQLAQIASLQDAVAFKEEIEPIKGKHHEIHLSKNTLAAFHKELKQLEQALASSGADKVMPATLADKSVSKQKQTLDNIREQLSLLNSERRAEANLAQSLVQQLSEKQSVLQTVTAWLDEHAADEVLLTNFPEIGRLKKLRTELLELSEKQKSSAKWTKTTRATLKNNKSTIEQERKKIAGLKQQLLAAEKELATMAEGENLAAIEDLRLEQQERVKSFQELNNLALAKQKLANGKLGFFRSLLGKGKEDDAEALSRELEQLKQQINLEENIKRALETAVFNEALLKKMEPERRHLVYGKPCPLCGAVQHPYVKRAPVPTNSQQALTDQRAKIQALIASTNQLNQRIIAAQKNDQNQQIRQTQLLQINAQWLTLCNRLNTASDELDIDNLKLMQRLLKVETAELQNIVALANRYRSTEGSIEKLKDLIAKNESSLEQLQERTHKLEAEWEGRPQEQIDIETALPRYQQEEKELTAKVEQELAALGEKMPAKGKEDALFDRLNSRRQDYHGYAFRRKNLTEELHALAEKEANCRANITVCDDKLARLNGQLGTEETVGLHLALIEKQKLIADKERMLAQQQAESERLERTLLEQMHGTQFTSLKQLSESLELMDHQPELERQLAELEQEIDAKRIVLEQYRVDLEAEQAHIISETSIEQLAVQLKSVSEKVDIAGHEVRRLEQLLQQQKQAQQRYDVIQSRLQEQEKIAEQCRIEIAQMVAEHGMAFRRRVQAKIAEQLLAKTNEVLEKISGRYYLRQRASEQGLALEIEDTYQGNVRRLPKTLSGGESFVVSLALALGLSELANNGKSVDSLFLDEGFGNLDAETLYTVISTLEGLHTHGKTVGVISHVEGVQKRFKAQLQVVKKANGMGELKKAS